MAGEQFSAEILSLIDRYGELTRLQGLLPETVEQPAYLSLAIGQVGQSLGEALAAKPDLLTALRAHEEARLYAGLGVLMVLSADRANMDEADRLFGESAEQYVGRCAMRLTVIAELVRPTAVEVTITEPEGVAAAASSDADEQVPPISPAIPDPSARIQVQIDPASRVIVNGKQLELLPVQRYLFELFLLARGQFKERDVYHLPEFEQLIQGVGQISGSPGAYANAIRGLMGRLELTGVSDFIKVVGGGPRSRVMAREASLSFVDERTFMPKTEPKADKETIELAEYIFDQLDPGVAGVVDTRAMALTYFNVSRGTDLSADQSRLWGQAVGYLSASLTDETDVEVDATTGRLTVLADDAAAEAQKRGQLLGISKDKVVFENETVDLNQVEQAIVAILTAQGERGARRNYIRDELTKRRIRPQEFEKAFWQLRDKLDGTIIQFNRRGKAYYKLNKPRPPKR